jgi:hypothetical protein
MNQPSQQDYQQTLNLSVSHDKLNQESYVRRASLHHLQQSH